MKSLDCSTDDTMILGLINNKGIWLESEIVTDDSEESGTQVSDICTLFGDTEVLRNGTVVSDEDEVSPKEVSGTLDCNDCILGQKGDVDISEDKSKLDGSCVFSDMKELEYIDVTEFIKDGTIVDTDWLDTVACAFNEIVTLLEEVLLDAL